MPANLPTQTTQGDLTVNKIPTFNGPRFNAGDTAFLAPSSLSQTIQTTRIVRVVQEPGMDAYIYTTTEPRSGPAKFHTGYQTVCDDELLLPELRPDATVSRGTVIKIEAVPAGRSPENKSENFYKYSLRLEDNSTAVRYEQVIIGGNRI